MNFTSLLERNPESKYWQGHSVFAFENTLPEAGGCRDVGREGGARNLLVTPEDPFITYRNDSVT